VLARLLLDVGHWVHRKPVELARAFKDAAQHGEDLVDRLVGEPALDDDLRAPGVDRCGRDLLEAQVAERRQQVALTAER